MLEDIGQYLQDESIAVIGTDLFYNRMVDDPDDCVAIFEYGGSAPDHTMNPDPGTAVSETIRVQVLVRSASNASARAKAREIFNKLDHFDGALSGVNYVYISATSSPFYLKRDERERSYYACNYEVTKELS